jgi:hypothetical protein
MSNINFNFITNEHTRSVISNGYMAVTQLELWDWLKEFEQAPDEGFIWTEHPNIYRIGVKMESLPDAPCHSGASFAITMRNLVFIAKNGIEEYKKKFTSDNVNIFT